MRLSYAMTQFPPRVFTSEFLYALKSQVLNLTLEFEAVGFMTDTIV